MEKDNQKKKHLFFPSENNSKKGNNNGFKPSLNWLFILVFVALIGLNFMGTDAT